MLQAYQFECKVCHNRSPVDSALLPVPVLPGPGDTAYAFTCGSCATTTNQATSFKHMKKSWLQIASTTLYNLQRTEKRKFFNLKDEVFQYVETHWEDLCNGRQETTNWQALLEGELKTHSAYFEPSPTLSGYWALRPSASNSLPGFIAKTTAKRTKLRTSGRGRSPSPTSEVDSAITDGEMEDMEAELSADAESKLGNGSDNGKSDIAEQMSDIEDEDMFHGDDDFLFDSKRKNKSDLSSSGGLSQSGPDGKRKKDKKNELSCSQDKGSPMWCHQCKQKHNEVVYCSRTCSKKYCNRCVWRHYREKVDQIDQAQWVCYYCRGVCSCAFCRRRRAKETNTKFESHRGKKRRITVDSHAIDDGVKKKRKLKASPEPKFVVDEDYIDDDFEDEDAPLHAESEEHEYYRQVAENAHPSSPKESLPSANLVDDLVEDEDEDERGALRNQRGDNRRSRDKRDPSQFDERRVTLKDLIDCGLLQADDVLVFRQSEQSATLLADGTILWMGTSYSSLSTFAKKVAHKLGQWTQGTLYNGWRVINCRGKVMDYYRKQYRKLLESNTVQQSDADTIPTLELKSEPIKYAAVSKDFAEQRLPLGSAQPPLVTYYMDSDDEEEEEDMEPSIRDSFETIAVMRNSANRATDEIRFKLENSDSSPSNTANESSEEDQWWLAHEEDHDLVYASPLSYSHEFHLPASPHHFVPVDEPRDILAIDHSYDQFLDIRDKDFFNVTSGIPDVVSRPATSASYHTIPLSAHVDVPRSDDLYSWGMDSSDFI